MVTQPLGWFVVTGQSAFHRFGPRQGRQRVDSNRLSDKQVARTPAIGIGVPQQCPIDSLVRPISALVEFTAATICRFILPEPSAVSCFWRVAGGRKR